MLSKIKTYIKQLLPLIISLLSFSILIVGTVNYSNYKNDLWEKDVKSRLFEVLMAKKTKLEQALYSRIYYTRSVAAYVSLKPDLKKIEFYNLAKELIKKDSVISTMALSRNCIIDAIYPEEGHEEAIGLNLLSHPERKEIVERTILTHKTFVAGPVELIEGGIAFISYTPIFDKTPNKNGEFWGVTDIVIYRDRLLKQANLNENEQGFSFALRGYNGTGNQGEVWWGNKRVFEQLPIKVSIDLPYGSWELAATPIIGWESYLNHDKVLLILLIASSLIISVLIWLISRSYVKIKRNEEELQAIFQSMNSLIIEFDHEGRYIKIPPVNPQLLVKPREELIQKTVFEVFSPEQAEMFHQAILKCLKLKKLIEIEYPLVIDNETIWFTARISWKSDDRVIYHAFNITEKKLAREKLIKSEARFKKLNATKDKFFSIIAHDLKSPFNIILGFSNLLRNSYDDFDDQKRKDLIKRIDESSKNTYVLLEKLLLWANSQTDNIVLEKEHLSLKILVMEAIEPYLPGAENKSINIDIRLSDDIIVFADKFTILTVIANLFNNAIKFTPHHGQVYIKSRFLDNYVEVCISDTGMGIPSETISKLFLTEGSISTKGTDNEKGSGLGLLLCKEFVEKHGGEIWLESEEGKGSKFYFTLPISKEAHIEASNVITYDSKSTIKDKNLKILIVDDDATSAEFIEIITTSYCREVIKATNGLEAVEKCKLHPDIDIIFMDIKMPVMDGFEASNEIRKFNRNVIIIAQSAFSQASDKINAKDSGCNYYLSKPINTTELIDLMKINF